MSGCFFSETWCRCYGWGTTKDSRFKIGDFPPTRAGLLKISRRWDCPTNHSFSQKTRINEILADFSVVLSHFTRLTDRQTDGRTEFSSLDRVCIPCSTVKTSHAAESCYSFTGNKPFLSGNAKFNSPQLCTPLTDYCQTWYDWLCRWPNSYANFRWIWSGREFPTKWE